MKYLGILLLSMTCFASPVSAGCAWVLWSNAQGLRNPLPNQFVPMSGYETKILCQKDVDAAYNRALERDGAIPPVTLLCLPDTIDPRSPK